MVLTSDNALERLTLQLGRSESFNADFAKKPAVGFYHLKAVTID
jgi:hypothetical protein